MFFVSFGFREFEAFFLSYAFIQRGLLDGVTCDLSHLLLEIEKASG